MTPLVADSAQHTALDLTKSIFTIMLRTIMRPTVLLNFGERGVVP